MGKGEATRRRIIEIAAPIFNQRGYSGCSLSELMEATGLEKGGIYRHFASKEDLAAEAFQYALAVNVKLRTDHLSAVAGSVNKLRRSVELFVETPSAVAGGCPLMNTAIEADDGNPRLRELALEGLRAWKGRLGKVVKEGLEAGEIRTGTSPGSVANVMVSTLEGALMISRMEGHRRALKDARAALDEMLQSIEVSSRPDGI
jgi:TetR/AcrR family transcriptional repressor of nem operon